MNEQSRYPNTVAVLADSYEGLTAVQLAALIAAFNNLVRPLEPQQIHSLFHEDPPAEIPAMDGGTRSAIEMAVIKICNRVADIADDSARWSVKRADKMAVQDKQIFKARMDALEAARQASVLSSSPAALYAPQVKIGSDGLFRVFLGSPETPETYISGAGRTIQDAIDDFNRKFTLAYGEQLNKNKPNEEDHLDTGNDGEIDDLESGGDS